MKICSKNQSQVILQVSVSDIDGLVKDGITTSNVRVYEISSGVEVDVLSSQDLSQVGTSNIYRYIWSPGSLSIGEYFIEYDFEDSDGNVAKNSDEFIVLNVPTFDEFDAVRKIQTGRWKILNNQMIFYDDDATTPILTFDLFNSSGEPASDNVFERNPV